MNAKNLYGKHFVCMVSWPSFMTAWLGWFCFSVATLGFGSFWAVRRFMVRLCSFISVNGIKLRFINTAVRLAAVLFAPFMVLCLGSLFLSVLFIELGAFGLNITIISLFRGLFVIILCLAAARFLAGFAIWLIEGFALETQLQRNSFEGSIYHLGFYLLFMFVLTVLSFGFAIPWCVKNIVCYVTDKSRFMGARIVFTGAYRSFPKKIFVIYFVLFFIGLGAQLAASAFYHPEFNLSEAELSLNILGLILVDFAAASYALSLFLRWFWQHLYIEKNLK
jgi:hypothetical protein